VVWRGRRTQRTPPRHREEADRSASLRADRRRAGVEHRTGSPWIASLGALGTKPGGHPTSGAARLPGSWVEDGGSVVSALGRDAVRVSRSAGRTHPLHLRTVATRGGAPGTTSGEVESRVGAWSARADRAVGETGATWTSVHGCGRSCTPRTDRVFVFSVRGNATGATPCFVYVHPSTKAGREDSPFDRTRCCRAGRTRPR
jgi:hypothetical protein